MRAFAVRDFGQVPALYDVPVPSEDGAFLNPLSIQGSTHSMTSSWHG